MKTIKIIEKRDPSGYQLRRVSDKKAKELIERWKGDSDISFTYSTKGAWKSRQNTLKKLEKAKRRTYFRKRRLAKSA